MNTILISLKHLKVLPLKILITHISLNCDYLDSTEFLNKYRDSKEYSLLSWNIQGLNSKFNELKEFFNILHSNDFTVDILALQETHQIANRDLLNLPNFKPLISKDRTSNRWGGIGPGP